MTAAEQAEVNGATSAREADFFLPDLCTPWAALVLVVVAELLALLLVLAGSDRLWPLPWDRLALVSFLVQWVALSSALLLCRLRPVLMRLPWAGAALASFIVIVLLTALFSSLGERLLAWYDPLQALSGAKTDLVLRNVLVGAIIGGLILRYFYLQAEVRRKQQAELSARVAALQARIRPHFLFNSMNIIASLIPVDPERAEQAVEDLSALFRASLRYEGEVTLDEELALCQHYVNIEELRLGDRLRVEWSLSGLPAGAVRIPALTLQPLLENAIYHGVEPRAEASTVRISAGLDHGRFTLVVTNPLAQGPSHRQGNRMAMDNIRLRLQAFYGGEARLRSHSDGQLYTVVLSYPFTVAAAGSKERDDESADL